MSLFSNEVKHSPKFDKVKVYYDNGLWKISRVRKAVVDGWITEEEYKMITNEEYEK